MFIERDRVPGFDYTLEIHQGTKTVANLCLDGAYHYSDFTLKDAGAQGG